MNLKCLQCVSEQIDFTNKKKKGQIHADLPQPRIEDAITLAPSWQMQQQGMQQMWACVAVPACLRHLNVQEVSALDQAIMGGKIILGGRGLGDIQRCCRDGRV